MQMVSRRLLIFSAELFDATLQFRIFQLKTGVFVSSPLTKVPESVQITEGRERRTVM